MKLPETWNADFGVFEGFGERVFSSCWSFGFWGVLFGVLHSFFFR
jgi:hypothetical protein